VHDEVTAGSGDRPSGTARVVDLNGSGGCRTSAGDGIHLPPSKEPLITGPEEDYQDTNFTAKRLSPVLAERLAKERETRTNRNESSDPGGQ
jgi:hypothetical protein